jgi:hypothetical protein
VARNSLSDCSFAESPRWRSQRLNHSSKLQQEFRLDRSHLSHRLSRLFSGSIRKKKCRIFFRTSAPAAVSLPWSNGQVEGQRPRLREWPTLGLRQAFCYHHCIFRIINQRSPHVYATKSKGFEDFTILESDMLTSGQGNLCMAAGRTCASGLLLSTFLQSRFPITDRRQVGHPQNEALHLHASGRHGPIRPGGSWSPCELQHADPGNCSKSSGGRVVQFMPPVCFKVPHQRSTA